MKKFIHKYIEEVTFFASIATIIGLIIEGCMIQNINVSIDKRISQYVNEIQELNNQINTSNINGNGNEVNIDSVVNKMIENPSAYSEEEIIRQAEISFAQKDYNKVLKLYSLDQVANSDIMYNNLAYMYSNGLGVKKI